MSQDGSCPAAAGRGLLQRGRFAVLGAGYASDAEQIEVVAVGQETGDVVWPDQWVGTVRLLEAREVVPGLVTERVVMPGVHGLFCPFELFAVERLDPLGLEHLTIHDPVVDRVRDGIERQHRDGLLAIHEDLHEEVLARCVLCGVSLTRRR